MERANTGSATMARKLSNPTKVGAVAPSHSQNAIAIVSNPGIKMIATLIASAGNRNGIDEDDDFTTETQSSQRGYSPQRHEEHEALKAKA